VTLDHVDELVLGVVDVPGRGNPAGITGSSKDRRSLVSSPVALIQTNESKTQRGAIRCWDA
jgi:hypothetical protein